MGRPRLSQVRVANNMSQIEASNKPHTRSRRSSRLWLSGKGLEKVVQTS